MKRNLLILALLILALAVYRPSGANDPAPPTSSQVEEPPPVKLYWYRGKWVTEDRVHSAGYRTLLGLPPQTFTRRPRLPPQPSKIRGVLPPKIENPMYMPIPKGVPFLPANPGPAKT